MRCQLQTAGVIVLLCLTVSGNETVLPQADTITSGLPRQADGRQLLQLRDKAGWLFTKSSKTFEPDSVPSASLTPAEKAQRLKDGRAVDLAALLELKQSFQPDSWKPLATWLEDGEPCTFAKVTCDANTGRVSEIDLTVSEDLAARYPELRSVIAAFEQNQNEQQIATNKRSVQEADSETTHQRASWEDPTLPKSITPWPAGMYPHTAISIEELPSGPAFMKLNDTLRALHVSNAQLLRRGLPASWGSFTSLRELTLAGLDLEGTLPADWAGMINMTQLILADNPKLHGSLPEAWGAMKQLKILDLSLNYASGLRSSISGILPHAWSEMTKLETLNLWRTSIVGHLPPAWVSMKHLQVLALSDTGISGSLPSAWSKMPRLATMHVANTLIGGALPSSWSKLKSLAMLDLRGTSVLQPVPASWQAFCKRNGTMVWDSVTQAYTWPASLQYGKVAHVYLPWPSPDGKLWEINHNELSPCNICQHLMSAQSMWGPIVLVVCSILLGMVGYRYRTGVSSLLRLRSGRLD